MTKEAAQQAPQIETVTVTLDEPIMHGNTKIAALTIRRPKAGALRGVSMVDLLNVNVSALQLVLPRITEPTLTRDDVINMDPADLMEIGMEVAAFLARKETRTSMNR